MAAKKRKDSSIAPRRRPLQARSRDKVSWLLEAAVQVFTADGYGATTNRIAERAGVSIGTLYEYFPNKDALLLALAERHVAEAEQGIAAALELGAVTELFPALQQAVLASQRYPSTVLGFIADTRDRRRLLQRVAALRKRTLSTLSERAQSAGLPQPAVRARIAFGLVGELSSLTFYEPELTPVHPEVAAQLLQLAFASFSVTPP